MQVKNMDISGFFSEKGLRRGFLRICGETRRRTGAGKRKPQSLP
jgi:hypothetical protein